MGILNPVRSLLVTGLTIIGCIMTVKVCPGPRRSGRRAASWRRRTGGITPGHGKWVAPSSKSFIQQPVSRSICVSSFYCWEDAVTLKSFACMYTGSLAPPVCCAFSFPRYPKTLSMYLKRWFISVIAPTPVCVLGGITRMREVCSFHGLFFFWLLIMYSHAEN